MNIFVITIFIINTVQVVFSANILGVFLFVGASHYVMFENVLKELALKGHDVDVFSHFPLKNAPKGYNHFNLAGSLPIFRNNLSVEVFQDFDTYKMVQFITNQCGVETCEATLQHPILEDLKNTKKKYDVLLTEIFGTDCALGFAHLFQIPTVQLISSVNLPWASDRFGNIDNPSYVPNYFLNYGAKMTLFERIHNTLTLLESKFLYHYFTSEEDIAAKKFFGNDLPSLKTLAQNTSLLLVNSHVSMNEARPSVPNVIEVGGLHVKQPKPLSPYFEELLSLDKNQKGVIYLTMGSMIMTESFTIPVLQALFGAFSEVPYKVVWKAVREKFPKEVTIPKNVHFENWMPQMDILCHPNVKLFVSHGGLMGSQEAVYCGVPRLGIPLFADQETNIRLAEKMGIAIRVGYNEITKKNILEATVKLLTEPKYQENIKRVSTQFKDRPLPPLDTAIYWVEYVIRHKGAPHLRTAGADLPWYQYHLIDVISILIGSLLIGLYSIIFVVRKILRKLTQGKTKKKRD